MLTTEKIKRAILHPDPNVRMQAIDYIARSFSGDPTVMPHVTEAVEKYGRAESVYFVGSSEQLPQSDETVRWCMNELKREQEEDQGEDLDRYWFAVSKALVNADPSLLRSRESAILELPQFADSLGTSLSERIRLPDEDSGMLWTKLEDFCERERHKQYLSEMDMPHANRLVEALGRDHSQTDRVLKMLKEDIDETADSARALMQGFIIRMAGELRITSAIPALIEHLKEDDEWFHEECERALIRIGGDEVLNALSEEFQTAEWHFRLYGTGVLENVHTEATAQVCLRLFEAEQDETIKVQLAHAAVSQFANEAIERVRQFILDSKLDPEIFDLRETLVSVSIVLDVEFPELEDWRSNDEQSRGLRRKLLAEKHGFGQTPPDDIADDIFESDGDVLAASAQSPSTFVRQDARVGRNDPCPCGSGKKYKKCCMNMPDGQHLLN